MSTATLTPAAKSLLASTIRALRTRLIDDLIHQAEGDYRPSVPLAQAKLSAAQARRRTILDAWIDERFRAAYPLPAKLTAEHQTRLLREAIKEVAATWLNRIVLLRHLEALGLSKPLVVTGGWSSPGYRQFRDFAPTLSSDPTGGYALLLRLLFDEHAVDLPGLFGEVGLERLFPLPAATLRELIEQLDDKGLVSAWTDDTTLGWVYQYWNDPERELLDQKIADGGKIEPSEIASKTQMFTERYMVEWLLHNSLGTTWLAICARRGWQAEAYQVLPTLEARRAEWRFKRESGEVGLEAFMPIENELEDYWKWYVPQPIAIDDTDERLLSIADIRLLDPACGSGHFLVIAFDLLAAMYREQARHMGIEINERCIANSIIENNLYGVDIDPRAVQIAAAALLLKARILDRKARPRRFNLVAPAFQFASLPPDYPAAVQFRDILRKECGISSEDSASLTDALKGVDYLGSLLKINRAITEVVDAVKQGRLFSENPAVGSATRQGTSATLMAQLQRFLALHTAENDLGVKLGGEQLSQGIRFLEIIREGHYDIVVGNPPYQGTSKMANAKYVAEKYTRGKADLYAAFLERSLELAKDNGISALLTMRGWMFLSQFKELRKHLLHGSDIRLIGDVDRGAFQEVPDEVISVVMTLIRRAKPGQDASTAVQPTALDDRSRDSKRTDRKRAALLAQMGRYEFDVRGFKAIEGEPVIYWWSTSTMAAYKDSKKVGQVNSVRQGMPTTDNTRYLRFPWEVRFRDIYICLYGDESSGRDFYKRWVPYIKGAEGSSWFESLDEIVQWDKNGLELKVGVEHEYGSVSKRVQSESFFFRQGVAFSMIGSIFSGRAHRYKSIFGNKGSSVFPVDVENTTCLLNSEYSKFVLKSLNPGIGFEVGDVNRLPISYIEHSDVIWRCLNQHFSKGESAREASVEFRYPGPSPWRFAQAWAQQAVDRPDGAPLPPYVEELDPPAPVAFVSFAFGVAMGRFCASGEGILDRTPTTALPHGILFLSARADEGGKDGLDHPACQPLHAAWSEHGVEVGEGDDLRTYLRKSFFVHVKDTYENRPIYFPLSSKQKSFVAWASIHRWADTTLQTLIADWLVLERRAIDAELEELRKARALATGKAKAAADKRFDKLKKLGEELDDFLAKVAQCADKGPPQVDREPARERDVSYRMDLDDGVMVNSAALWPLLDPQWKDPKKWWKELASAQGRKDYDWSHLAARYFPTRVDAKCEQDPSLAVAHGCFWRLHPAKAYAWELRLQDEIRPEFTIDEVKSKDLRDDFKQKQQKLAREIEQKELQRRERKAAKADEDQLPGLDEEESDEPTEAELETTGEAVSVPSEPALQPAPTAPKKPRKPRSAPSDTIALAFDSVSLEPGTIGAACHKALESGLTLERLSSVWQVSMELAELMAKSDIKLDHENPDLFSEALRKSIPSIDLLRARKISSWFAEQEEAPPAAMTMKAARSKREKLP